MTRNLSILFLFLFSTLALTVNAQLLPEQIKKAYQQQKEELPAEKIYLQTDRTLYKPNEYVWFNAHVVTPSNLPSDQTHLLYIEWIGPNGNVIRRLNIPRQHNPNFAGDIHIPHNAVGGVYKIRAYSRWMRNFGDDQFFEKEITVQTVVLPRLLMKLDFEREAYSANEEVIATLELRNLQDEVLDNFGFEYVVQLDGKTVQTLQGQTDENGEALLKFFLPNDLNTIDGLVNVMIKYEGKNEGISRAIPILLNNIQMQFFPEGGDLVYGMTNRVAFEAMDEFGKPADFRGVVMDDLGTTIANLESYHQGMGAFEFEPVRGRKYFVQVTSPQIEEKFELPKTMSNSIGLRKVHHDKNSISFYIHTPKRQILYFIAEVGDSLYPLKTVENARSDVYHFDVEHLPMGIMKLTVFDEGLRPHGERLVFINKHRELQFEIEKDQEAYLPKDLVKLDITVKDDEGHPVDGHFSIAVVEDKQHTFIDDKQDNIMSGLLMSEELKGEVFEPNFYFDPKEEKAEQALDYVMMTKGWRRFQWKDILEKERKDWIALRKYDKEIQKITGTVYVNNSPIKGAKVYFEGDEANSVKSDGNGRFELFTDKRGIMPNVVHVKYKGLTHKQYLHHNSFAYDVLTQTTNNISVNVNDIKNNVVDVAVAETEKATETDVSQVSQTNDKIETSPTVASNADVIVRGNTNVNSASAIMAIPEVDGVTLSSIQVVSESIVVGYGYVNENAMDDYDIDVDMDEYRVPYIRLYVDNMNTYYNYPRQFYAPNYSSFHRNYRNHPNHYYYRRKTDFRKTLYWSPNINVKNGKAAVQFYASDENTTHRIILEGITNDGKVGRTESTFYVQDRVSVDVLYPEIVTTNDEFYITVTIKNNTHLPTKVNINDYINGNRSYNHPSYLRFETSEYTFEIPAFDYVVARLKCDAGANAGQKYFWLDIKGDFLNQSYQKAIKVEAKGFPTQLTLAGDKTKKFTFDMSEAEEGTLTGEFIAYPNMLGMLMDGVKSMIRAPYGCFTQVSSSNYPNVMAMQFMNALDMDDPKTRRTAYNYMSTAYDKLSGYECSTGGFDWYGRNPGNVRLTAYGILQFMDMKEVFPKVSTAMIDRSARWLYGQRNKTGGWYGNYYGWQNYASTQDAYILYALAKHGKMNIDLELSRAYEISMNQKDWYQMALVAMALQYKGQKDKANKLLDLLMAEIEKKGLKNPSVYNTITWSYGYYMHVETWSLVAQAIIALEREDLYMDLSNIIQKLMESRRGHGYFGSTQTTVQALKAIIEYAKVMNVKRESEGTMEIFVNGKLIKSESYEPKTYQPIKVNLAQYLETGQNVVEVKFDDDKNAMPYTSEISWSTLTPSSSDECQLALNTTLSKSVAKVGETVRMKIDLKNKLDEAVYNPIAIVGIPSGLSLQPWQLKELMDKETIAYYEIQENNIVLYFRHFTNDETRTVNLDLKADIAGTYRGIASSAYLYYAAEKDWKKGVNVIVKP